MLGHLSVETKDLHVYLLRCKSAIFSPVQTIVYLLINVFFHIVLTRFSFTTRNVEISFREGSGSNPVVHLHRI